MSIIIPFPATEPRPLDVLDGDHAEYRNNNDGTWTLYFVLGLDYHLVATFPDKAAMELCMKHMQFAAPGWSR